MKGEAKMVKTGLATVRDQTMKPKMVNIPILTPHIGHLVCPNQLRAEVCGSFIFLSSNLILS